MYWKKGALREMYEHRYRIIIIIIIIIIIM
jgi:hypothetical protein